MDHQIDHTLDLLAEELVLLQREIRGASSEDGAMREKFLRIKEIESALNTHHGN